MKIQVNGQEQDVPQENMAVVQYQNDLLNGLYIDMDDNYAFISAHCGDGNRAVIKDMRSGGVQTFDLTEHDVDLSEPPHLWIVNSMARIVVESAEQLCIEACDE